MITARTILLVDDDEGIRESLGEMLSDEGFSVHEARNGKEALEWLRHHKDPPCVVLLDLMMPVMDGAAFLDVRHADPALSQIPVVVITAGGSSPSVEQTNEIHAFLPKPIATSELLAAIDDACDGSWPRAPLPS